MNDDRRERYAAAIGAKGIHNVNVIRLAADAAMAVADEELRDERRYSLHLDDENALLRTELRWAKERHEAAEAEVREQDDDLARLRVELSQLAVDALAVETQADELEATIKRARAVLAEWYGTSDASALGSAVREALEDPCQGCGEPTNNSGAHGYGAEFGGCV